MSSTLLLSLVVGTFVGGAAAYLGSLMITKRMALVGDALGHVALPGMGIALVMNLDMTFGALLFLAMGVYLIWKLGEHTVLSSETLVGIVFVSALAIGFFIVPQPDLLEALIGDISHIAPTSASIAVVASLITFAIVRHIYHAMMLLNVSEDLASVEGIKARRYNLIYLCSVALIVSIGVKITGSLLVGALVIVPPATARILSKRLSQYAGLSIFFGVLSNVLGIIVSSEFHFPTGPTIILMSTLFFVLAFFQRSA